MRNTNSHPNQQSSSFCFHFHFLLSFFFFFSHSILSHPLDFLNRAFWSWERFEGKRRWKRRKSLSCHRFQYVDVRRKREKRKKETGEKVKFELSNQTWPLITLWTRFRFSFFHWSDSLFFLIPFFSFFPFLSVSFFLSFSSIKRIVSREEKKVSCSLLASAQTNNYSVCINKKLRMNERQDFCLLAFNARKERKNLSERKRNWRKKKRKKETLWFTLIAIEKERRRNRRKENEHV